MDGRAGVVVASRGRLRLVLTVTVRGDRVVGYDVTADPDRLRLVIAAPPDFYRDLNQVR